MNITTNNAWDTRDGFSVPHGSRRADPAETRHANILGAQDREAAYYPANLDSGPAPRDDEGLMRWVGGNNAPDEEGTTALSRVIGMWLQWSSAYEEVSGRMFQEGEDTQKLEAMLDEMDQLRLEAVELSEDLLKD